MAAPYGDKTGSPMKNADGITEGFKTAAQYGDVSYLLSEQPTESRTEQAVGESVGKS